ncbi:MAG: histone deacetylase [Chloroflexota bacterium]
MTTAYVTHQRYIEHKMQNYQHPEHPGRIQAVWDVFEAANLPERLHILTPDPVTDEQITRVHTRKHLETLAMISAQDQMMMYDQDTYALPTTPLIARLSAGGIVTAVDAVMRGDADNALAAVRPPGHHATPSRAMGFCILSNVAIAARYAQDTYNAKRVLIVDYDVHHGNGTQDVFYDDDSVLFVSTHQYPYYPGTGSMDETGKNGAEGTTLNVPLSAGHGDANYARVFDEIVIPAAKRFKPDLVIVSAGFDAHHVDPLAGMKLSHTGYVDLSRKLVALAGDVCEGKIVFALEGGYDLPAVSHGMRNVAHVLLGEDDMIDSYGTANVREPDVGGIIEQVQAVHNI